jgi:Holliday junction resolvase
MPKKIWQNHYMKESDILKQVRDYLRWHGWYIYRNHQSLGSHKGLSDLTAIRDGKTIWIEIKKPGGKPSDHQIKFAQEIESHGGIYLIITRIEDWPIKEKE